ncbi:MAG: acyltransferase [Kaiparowitsia implicata GSE-PSE-MK54-09C]|nr:acyltransferase [Kaiparowitsia implicata GSE-PSE-MK54-09C]
MTTLTKPVAEPRRLVSIELLRFLASFAILVWHYEHFAFDGEVFTVARWDQPFHALLWPFYDWGQNGVQVFWCVSGFIFVFKYYLPVRRGDMSAREFFILRLSRLYPLHFVTLLFVAGVQVLFLAQNGYFFVYPQNDVKHFVLNLFLASYWGLQDGWSFNAPIWSVSLEILVYAIFFSLSRRLSFVATAIVAVVLAGVMLALGASDMAQCLGFFYIGGTMAVACYNPRLLWNGPLAAHAFVALGVALAAAGILVAAAFLLKGIHIQIVTKLVVVTALVYVFVALNPLMQRFAAPLLFLGSLTYASYLLHFPLQLTVAYAFSLAGIPLDSTSSVLFVLFIGGTLVLAALCYRHFEMPAQRGLRVRLLRRERAALA